MSLFFIIIVVIILSSLFGSKAKTKSYDSSETNTPKGEEELLNHLMCVVAYLMKQDNIAKVCELEEVKIFLKRFFPTKDPNIPLQQLRIYLRSNLTEFQVNNSCRILNRHFNYESKLLIVQLLFKIAASDGGIDIKEMRFINYVASYLRISQADYNNIGSNFHYRHSNTNNNNDNYSESNYYYGGSNSNSRSNGNVNIYENYKILGVTPYATDKEIKQAFREKAKIFHPDKYVNKTEAEKEKAKEKFQELNNAYEAICKEKNIK